ncbi:uncharacterized protein ACRADG_012979 isoform 2-T2 [Cochliomyia hominivorax]
MRGFLIVILAGILSYQIQNISCDQIEETEIKDPLKEESNNNENILKNKNFTSKYKESEIQKKDEELSDVNVLSDETENAEESGKRVARTIGFGRPIFYRRPIFYGGFGYRRFGFGGFYGHRRILGRRRFGFYDPTPWYEKHFYTITLAPSCLKVFVVNFC